MILNTYRSLFDLLLPSLFAACGGAHVAPPPTDAGDSDAGNLDAGPSDAAPLDAGDLDGGAPFDLGATDLGAPPLVSSTYIKASNTGAHDWFGSSVSLSSDGTRLAVGAFLERSSATGVGGNQADNRASWSGAVYVF